MSTRTIPAPISTPASLPAAARAVLSLLARLAHGSLELQLPDGAVLQQGRGSPHAVLRVHHWRAFVRGLKSGDIGFAESHFDGDWSTPDLPALLTLLAANRESLERLVYGSWWGRLGYRLRHLLNRNSRRGSARNIHAHYDLGNDFYRLWLGDSMCYSSAWFGGDPARSLEAAHCAKMRRALAEAGVGTGSRVLEIGCGWGGLAGLASREFAASVTGVTLSREQLAWAQAQHGAQADLRLQDYRELGDEFASRPFDAIVSIEMFEAVGREYWDGYFETVRRCLKPGGRACIQTITIRDDLFERYARGTDFIQQYVFPGGLLPSRAEFERAAQRAELQVLQRHAFGPDYARTLALWRLAFARAEAAVRALGFDERFLRIWNFYLCYCEAAFTAGDTDVVQFTLGR